ncbi:hypothetical protein [Streptomyces liliifuscus]|uniref:Uncharacterized protein n=1 Tax=Streptomyces liliifuscus TaxID=2797636 RepID=A0A7T7RFW3_9ACTN|nr:hypothetical protein [Streptomyces liliifuscus]QQM45120.1 hypothetical protein JEQ17_40800 [Streptomyces liliifuscus]
MTTAVREAPHHRNLTCVKEYRCRRPGCLARSAEYDRTRTRLVAYGRWQPFTDAEPVRRHVRMLGSYGIGWQRVSRLSGVSNGGMSRLLYGDYSRGRQPSKRVRTQTADRIYTVRADIGNVAPTALVDGTGTRRRIQALVANGWPQMRLGVELDLNHYRMIWERARSEMVTGASARQVLDLYSQLWNVDPASRGIAPRYIAQAKRIAKVNGWAPPGAWDDDYIDSPSAEPDLGDDVDRYTAIAEDARWLIGEQNYTVPQAAHRLGITSEHLYRALRERPEADAAGQAEAVAA